MSPALRPRYEWNQLPWTRIQRQVFKLQRRIYRAAQRKDQRLVHRLQRLMMRSWYARLLAVRRVTQENRGKRTAGIDGIAKLVAKERLKLARGITLSAKPKPVRRIWIDKRNGKEKRPLGIPVMADRARQAWVKLALEPEWEAKFEPNSYGFRPGRSAHDAIAAIFIAIVHKPKYVLDADIAQCFDRIDHQALLAKLKAPPRLRRLINCWLKAGVWDHGDWYPGTQGTPQGGVISPLLANIALDGLETYLKEQFPSRASTRGGKFRRVPSVQVIRYADDFVVLHPELRVVQAAKTATEQWLAQQGLTLKPSKTRIVHTLGAPGGDTGFDFLGFHIRQYPVSPRQNPKGYKTLIKPSKTAIRRHYQQLRYLIKAHRGKAQRSLIANLNHCIRGWSRYYSTVVSSHSFAWLDNLLQRLLLAWTRRRSDTLTGYQKMAQYWGIDRGMGWVFCTRHNFRLVLHREMPIKRHIKVRLDKSPFDGDWLYWASRRGNYPGTSTKVAQLLKQQQGRCAHCGLFFEAETPIEIHHVNRDRQQNQPGNLRALHSHCHHQVHREETSLTTVSMTKTRFTEEPCEGKLSRTVLKPSGRGDSLA